MYLTFSSICAFLVTFTSSSFLRHVTSSTFFIQNFSSETSVETGEPNTDLVCKHVDISVVRVPSKICLLLYYMYQKRSYIAFNKHYYCLNWTVQWFLQVVRKNRWCMLRYKHTYEMSVVKNSNAAGEIPFNILFGICDSWKQKLYIVSSKAWHIWNMKLFKSTVPSPTATPGNTFYTVEAKRRKKFFVFVYDNISTLGKNSNMP